jgi:hypothetical protein
MESTSGVKGNKPKQNTQMSDFNKMLSFLSTILPSNLFLKQKSILCPLRSDYLRTQPKEILFNYGNHAEITMLAKVTRQLDIPLGLENLEFKNMLSMSDMMIEMTDLFVSQFGMGDIGDFIVSPIAIFFESI